MNEYTRKQKKTIETMTGISFKEFSNEFLLRKMKEIELKEKINNYEITKYKKYFTSKGIK